MAIGAKRVGPAVIRQALPLALALSVTQVIGWATAFNALALLARPISVDLGLSLPMALAGSSLFLVALAVTSRALVPLYARHGPGRILTAGSLVATAGFISIAVANGPVSYAAGWLILGVGGAGMLTAPAHALLVQGLGSAAKRWIAGVMLVSGLAGSVGLPATALLLTVMDWRGVMLAFAALHLLVCAPLHLWASRSTTPDRADTPRPTARPSQAERSLFRWLALSVSLIGFVTWGFAIVVVQLLQETGLDEAKAVAAAALIGVATVLARAVEFALAPHLAASRAAIWSTAALALSLAVLALGGSAAAWVFVVLFGAASGTMSVARATLPLELFDPSSYAAMAGRLALPMNLAFAAAPFIFGLVLQAGGAPSALGLAMFATVLALAALIRLRGAAKMERRA